MNKFNVFKLFDFKVILCRTLSNFLLLHLFIVLVRALLLNYFYFVFKAHKAPFENVYIKRLRLFCSTFYYAIGLWSVDQEKPNNCSLKYFFNNKGLIDYIRGKEIDNQNFLWICRYHDSEKQLCIHFRKMFEPSHLVISLLKNNEWSNLHRIYIFVTLLIRLHIPTRYQEE